jgi:hypothetical protein
MGLGAEGMGLRIKDSGLSYERGRLEVGGGKFKDKD